MPNQAAIKKGTGRPSRRCGRTGNPNHKIAPSRPPSRLKRPSNDGSPCQPVGLEGQSQTRLSLTTTDLSFRYHHVLLFYFPSFIISFSIVFTFGIAFMRFPFGVRLEDTPSRLCFSLTRALLWSLDKTSMRRCRKVGSSLDTSQDLGVLDVQMLVDLAGCCWSRAWRGLTMHSTALKVLFSFLVRGSGIGSWTVKLLGISRWAIEWVVIMAVFLASSSGRSS